MEDRWKRQPAFACRGRRLLAAAVLLFGTVAIAGARDFPEPLDYHLRFPKRRVEALAGPLDGLLPGGLADIAYHRYAFVDGPHDLFSLRQRILVDLYAGDALELGVYYHNHLLVGPVTPGEDAFSVAEWNMNAIQFEYGAIARVPIGRSGVVSASYGRTSQHPLRGGYSEVSSDIVEAAFAATVSRTRRTRLDGGLRLAWIDLFDAWQSPLPAPRTAARLEIPIEGRMRLRRVPGAVALVRLWPRVILTRTEDTWPYADVEPRMQTEIDAEAGLRYEARSVLEVMLELYSSADSEQLDGEPAPLTTLGFVIRLGME